MRLMSGPHVATIETATTELSVDVRGSNSGWFAIVKLLNRQPRKHPI